MDEPNIDWLSASDVRREMQRLLWVRNDPGDPDRHAWEQARRASALDFVRALAKSIQKNPATDPVTDPHALLADGVEQCVPVVEIAKLISGAVVP